LLRMLPVMVTLGAVGLVAAFAGRVRGGSFDRLAATQFRFVPLLLAGLALQILSAAWSPPWLSDRMALALLLWSNLALLVFIVLNRRLPGTMLMAVGLALNVLVIAANQAMPVSVAAARVAQVGHTPGAANLEHEVAGVDTRLAWLGDVIPLPKLGEVLSLGDLALIAGTGRLVYLQTRGPRPKRRASSAAASG
jgi:hypothetical protein